MVKKYTINMAKQEIINRLQNNETIKIENGKTEYALNMYDDKIEFGLDGTGKHHLYIHCRLDILNSNLKFFFEDKKEFAINETGLYKTRDGRKAFVSIIFSNVSNEASGVIEGRYKPFTWKCDGRIYDEDIESEDDIISKWEE